MSDAITLKLYHNIDKDYLRFITEKGWEIPKRYLQFYHNYYLMYWTGAYIKYWIRNGTVIHSGVKYKVIFYFCTPEKVYSSRQVRLSFRNPIEVTGLLPTVLISIKR